MAIESHSVIIIYSILDDMMGNASTGSSLALLKSNVATLDTGYQGLSAGALKTRVHNWLVQVQGCLVGDTDEWTYTGSLSSTMEGFNTSAEDLIECL